MPNSAALSALTSAIRLSTNTWARRASSLSMTARSWRYWGSLAVMMSELVLGSAWIWPPVLGWLAVPAAAAPAAGVAAGLLPRVSALMAARSVPASWVALAFFR